MASEDPNHYEIHLAVDDGYVNATVAMQCIEKGAVLDPSLTTILALQEGSKESPQVIGLVRDQGEYRTYWGEELQTMLNDDDFSQREIFVFDSLKAFLFPTPETTKLTQTIEERLRALPGPEMTVIDLITLFHRAKYEETLTQIARRLTNKRWTVDQIRKMDIHTIFTVPEMSTSAQLHTLQNILKAAGYKNATPLTETEDAGAWRSYQLKESGMLSIPQHVERLPGQQESYGLIIVDAGGLTCNVIEYKCFGFVAKGADVIVRPTGRREGAACGSEATITEYCFQHAKQVCEEEYKGFTRCVTALGFRDESEFRRALAGDFESYKVRWEQETARTIMMSGRAQGDLAAGRVTIKINLTKALIKGWFDKAAEEISGTIDKVLSPDTKIISFAGGFLRSKYLVRSLRERYEARGIWMPDAGSDLFTTDDFPVVQGAICRNVLQQKPAVTKQFVLGLGQEEIYNPIWHAELPNESPFIIQSAYTEDFYVENRWLTLLAPGELANDANASKTSVPQEFQLTLTHPVVQSQLYTSRVAIPDHSPLYVNGALREGVEKWGEVIKHQVLKDDLTQYPELPGKWEGYETKYRMWAWLKIERTGPGGTDV